MSSLSKRLLGLVLIASCAVPLGYARSAIAQVPVFADPNAEAEPEAAPPAGAPVEPVLTPVAEPLPPAPPAPAGVAPAASSAARPAPAKAAVISARDEGGQRAPIDVVESDADVDKAPRSYWYGWQTLIADGSSLAALLLGGSLADSSSGDTSDSLVALGLLGYEAAPAIIHFVHRNPGRGFASAGLRLGMPLAGAFLGASLASGCDTNQCEAGGAALGLLLGMGGAMAIDAAVFAYEAPKPSERRAGLQPLFMLTPRQAWLGIGGRL